MTAVGGSIESVSLSGRNFPVPADAEVTRKLGGWENEVQMNGDGTARLIKTRVPLSIDGLTVEIDDDRGDHEYLTDLAGQEDFFAAAITYASGLTYQCKAQIVGEIQAASKAGTAQISLSGPGVLSQQ